MRHTFWIIVALVLFSACERNFDELNDTDQRSVTFAFYLDDFFDDVLMYQNGEVSLGDPSGLDEQHRIRITGFCYNDTGKLVSMESLFTLQDEKPDMKFKHLYKDVEYKFIFLVDVVEYYSNDNYYEMWYYLKENQIEQLQVASFERNDMAKHNVLKRGIATVTPSNQVIDIALEPVTFNGYLEFTNLSDNVRKISGYTGCHQSFHALSMEGALYTGRFAFENTQPHQIPTVVPITATMADDFVLIESHLYTSQTANDSTVCPIHTENHKKFIATFDCQTLSISNCNYY